jgi:pyruvate dehydrogenase complex dehydrogenase (E1) component
MKFNETLTKLFGGKPKNVPFQAVKIEGKEAEVFAFDKEEDLRKWVEELSDEDYERYDKQDGIYLIKNAPVVVLQYDESLGD